MISKLVSVLCLGLMAVEAAAATPRSIAVVAVAVAVDELLQSNTPALPDTLDKGEAAKPDNAEPQPLGTPCECPRKCGKLGCQCQQAAAAVEAGSGSKPLLTLDAAALGSIKPLPKREKLLVYSQANCGPCDRFRTDNGAGDADIGIEYPEGAPPFAVAGFPAIYSPSRRAIRVGYATMPELRAWLGLPAVRPAAVLGAVGAVTVGTIDGAGIRAALAKLRSSGKSTVLTIEGAEIIVPATLSIELSTSPERVAIRFPATPRPRLSLGSGLMKISQPISALAFSGELLTVGLDGFPDLAFRVE